MRTLIYGDVSQGDLDDAELLMGITPTSFRTETTSSQPPTDLEIEVLKQCPMIPGEQGLMQLHRRLAVWVEAAIVVNPPEHLAACLADYDIPVHHIER